VVESRIFLTVFLLLSLIAFGSAAAAPGPELSLCEPSLEDIEEFSFEGGASEDAGEVKVGKSILSAPGLCPAGITARCVDIPPPTYAWFDPDTCEMVFLRQHCPTPLPNGVNSADWWWEYFNNLVESFADAQSCVAACRGRHEACHAQDYARDPGIEGCRTELNCYNDSRRCLARCDWLHCLGYPILSQDRFCRELAKKLRMAERAWNFNNRVCNLLSRPSSCNDSPCLEIEAECRREGGSPEECRFFAEHYC